MNAVELPAPARAVTPVAVATERLGDVVRRLRERGRVEPEITAELTELVALVGGLDAYLEACTSPASSTLTALADDTARHDWSVGHRTDLGLEREMLSGHVEGQFLKLLVHVAHARHVLEIGTFTGYATLAMAEGLDPDGRIVTCEVDDDVARIARRSFDATRYADRIDVRVGPATRTLRALKGEQFDLIFIDADKAGYVDYFRAVLDLDLLGPRGLLCIDNTLMQGLPWTAPDRTPNAAAIARFNEVVVADPRVEQVVVPLRDGITLARLAAPAEGEAG